MAGEVSEEAKKAIVDLLPGTSGHYDHIIREEHGLEDDQIEAVMTETGHFRCEVCGWWCWDDELADDEDGSTCTDCKED